MSRIIKNNDPQRLRTQKECAAAEVARLRNEDALADKRLLARKRAARRGLSNVNVNAHGSLPGDRTGNTPPLRRDAKFRNKLDLNAFAYLTLRPGYLACRKSNGEPDIAFTLAVIQHYRHIMASRQTPPDLKGQA